MPSILRQQHQGGEASLCLSPCTRGADEHGKVGGRAGGGAAQRGGQTPPRSRGGVSTGRAGSCGRPHARGFSPLAPRVPRSPLCATLHPGPDRGGGCGARPAARVRTREPVPSVCCVSGTGAGTKLHRAKARARGAHVPGRGTANSRPRAHARGICPRRRARGKPRAWCRPRLMLRRRTREATARTT